MTKPLISVIVPVYNVAPYLLECFESLTSQTYNNLEIIIVDDGSTDTSRSICEKYAQSDPRVIFKHQKNAGMPNASNARNTALSLARGDYIFFLDSDDYLAHGCIKYLVNLAEKTHSPISICPHYEQRGTNNLRNFNSASVEDGILSIEQALENMLLERGFNLQVTPKLFKRSLFEQTPKIRFPEKELHEDVSTTYRLFLRAYRNSPSATIAFGSKPKYYYNIRSSSITNSGFDKRRLVLITRTDEMCDAIDKIFPGLEDATNLRRLHARFSILRQTNSKLLSKNLAHYIKEHASWITKNPEASKRDKLALISLKLGLPVFRCSWKIYELLFK